MKTPSPEHQKMLESLKAAAQKAQEKKNASANMRWSGSTINRSLSAMTSHQKPAAFRINSRDRGPDHPPFPSCYIPAATMTCAS
ncbi:MAG: hypothetical protein A2521_09660 [Deltaproteobacteria bacterium RIFOXYD12_FULL_57_12]|nr:MAG: hypothetical protein A2521_09660 [Deltaproteobacteria bacterium RIFOXYD12_FULL_57_12]